MRARRVAIASRGSDERPLLTSPGRGRQDPRNRQFLPRLLDRHSQPANSKASGQTAQKTRCVMAKLSPGKDATARRFGKSMRSWPGVDYVAFAWSMAS